MCLSDLLKVNQMVDTECHPPWFSLLVFNNKSIILIYSNDIKSDTEIAYCQMVLFIYKYHHYFYLYFAQNGA